MRSKKATVLYAILAVAIVLICLCIAGCNRCAVFGHTVVTDEAVAATCTTAGKTEGSHCSVCNTVLEEQKSIPAQGHTVVVDPAVEATSTTTGLTEGSHCSVCGEVLTSQQTVPATGATSGTPSNSSSNKGSSGSSATSGTPSDSSSSKSSSGSGAPSGTPSNSSSNKGSSGSGATSGTPSNSSSNKGSSSSDAPSGSHCSVYGHTAVTDAAVAATCTKTGLTKGSHCSVCGTVLVAQEVTPALGHTSATDAAVAATCTEDGMTEGSHCSVCGTVLVAQETVPATGHDYETVGAKDATCTEAGSTGTTKCSTCGFVLNAAEEIPATGHTVVTDAAVGATCTASGLTEGSHCSVCNAVLTKQETVPATGHTAVTDDAVAATCTTPGLTEGSHCSSCGAVLVAQTTVPATGHNGATTGSKDPTCTEDGSTGEIKCTKCDEVLMEAQVIPATGHKFGPVTQTKAPAEDADGEGVVSCTNVGCTESYKVLIPATSHSIVSETVIQQPTCSSYGSVKITCSCGETSTYAIDMTDHNLRVVDSKAATCTSAGYSTEACTKCGYYITTNTPALGHNFVMHSGTLPTCTTSGNTAYMECTNCGLKSGWWYQPALGHRAVRHSAADATVATQGNIEYYQCSRCNKYFSDEACTKELAESEVFIPKITRENLEAYSWNEIKQIANVISACSSEDEAIEVAKFYNLVGTDGKLTGNEQKSFTYSFEGKSYTCHVQILGFWHDTVTSTGNKAGITFGFVEAFGNFKANGYLTNNNGGWKATYLYKETLPTAYYGLPEEIRNNIVKVTKMTNNKGITTDASAVTATSESFWLLSTREVYDYTSSTLPTYGLEGYQYQLYSDNNVSIYRKNALLMKKNFACDSDVGMYWLRTPVPYVTDSIHHTGGYGAVSETDGITYEFEETNSFENISPCFCF